MLLEENTLPKSYYQAKKILCLMCMQYPKILTCLNDCILYRQEFEEMHNCPRSGISQYKVKDDDECSSNKSTEKGPQRKTLTASGSAGYASKGKHVAKKLLSDEKDIVFDVYAVSKNSCMP